METSTDRYTRRAGEWGEGVRAGAGTKGMKVRPICKPFREYMRSAFCELMKGELINRCTFGWLSTWNTTVALVVPMRTGRRMVPTVALGCLLMVLSRTEALVSMAEVSHHWLEMMLTALSESSKAVRAMLLTVQGTLGRVTPGSMARSMAWRYRVGVSGDELWTGAIREERAFTGEAAYGSLLPGPLESPEGLGLPCARARREVRARFERAYVAFS